MSLIDKFLNSIKLSDDDFDEEEDFLDADDDLDEEEYRSSKPRRFFGKSDDDDDDLDAPRPSRGASSSAPKEKEKPSSPKPVRKERVKKAPKSAPKRTPRSGGQMEVSVIKPKTMEDAREITDTLLDECTVILNLEGLDVDIAQRIIDFTCGSCYSLEGSIQMISSYIFILTPASVDITGDYQSLLSDAFDVPAMRSAY